MKRKQVMLFFAKMLALFAIIFSCQKHLSKEYQAKNHQIQDLGILTLSNFSITSREVMQDTNVIMLVITRWYSWDTRYQIRQSFGRTHKLPNYNYQLLFLFGILQAGDVGIPEEYTRVIWYENEVYHDLLIPQVEDNYHTVAMKLLAAFHWISTVETAKIDWLIKLDDDVIVNLDFLDNYLASANPRKIHCNLLTQPDQLIPMRWPESKWFVSKMDWSPNEYPNYCAGPTYIMSPQSAVAIYEGFATFFHQDYIWIEDLYLTGILPSKLGLEHEHFELFTSDDDNSTEFIAMLLHGMTAEQRAAKWHELFRKRANWDTKNSQAY